jgi:hypothetical protein
VHLEGALAAAVSAKDDDTHWTLVEFTPRPDEDPLWSVDVRLPALTCQR